MAKKLVKNVGQRTLIDAALEIPREDFKKKNTLPIPDFQRLQKSLVLIENHREVFSQTGTTTIHKAQQRFTATGRVRCLKTDPKKEKKDIYYIGVRKLGDKTIHWVPCYKLHCLTPIISISGKVTDTAKPRNGSSTKHRDHPRRKGIRPHTQSVHSSQPF